MLAVANESALFGNMNISKYKGCGAGRHNFSVNVDGLLSPCRNLDIYEESNSLLEYWNNSEVLKKLRAIEDDRREPCLSCKYSDYCRHCQAISYKLHGELFLGNSVCELARE